MGALFRPAKQAPAPKAKEAAAAVSESGLPDWITEAYLTVDGESRSGEKLEAVRDIAVHYVANAGTSAMANRNYFEGPDSNTSSHFIVGLEGEVLIMIPTDERSCATNSRNPDTISVEVCHPDASGVFSDATYESLIRLLAYLCEEHGLSEENLIRHYDVTGKMCPRYYVEHPEAWAKMKADVKEQLAKGGNRETAS
ncbi:MAG: N-acetylmuramoyl-L-alanine amidase [Ruminococcaceae bacterium]|nr:N-acetylmuramoyl-L-alanine amidase [Oscillospiraceae bacterium]